MKTIFKFLLFLLASTVVVQTSAQGLVFSNPVQAIGTISEDDAPRVYKFRYRNTSKTPLVILRVVTTCGCTEPSFSRQPIAAGAQGEVSVTFHPRGRAGALHKTLSVYTNLSAAKPAERLVLEGTVGVSTDSFSGFPVRMGALRLKRQSIDFRSVNASRRRVERIEVANTGHRPLRLSAMGLPAYVEFRTEPQVIAPDSVGDLVFTLRTEQIPKPGAFTAEIYLDNLGEPLPPSKRAISLRGEKN